MVGVSDGEQGGLTFLLADTPKSGDDLGSHEAAECSAVVELGQSILAIYVVSSPIILEMAKILEHWRGYFRRGEDTPRRPRAQIPCGVARYAGHQMRVSGRMLRVSSSALS